MPRGILDDLDDWGEVLADLARLRQDGLLDDHQPQLARLARYRDNWRLQAEALKCAVLIKRADDLLVADALNALVDPELTVEVRVLAARALGHLVPRCPTGDPTRLDLRGVLRTMSVLAEGPCNPILRDEIIIALEEAERPTGLDTPELPTGPDRTDIQRNLPDTTAHGLVRG